VWVIQVPERERARGMSELETRVVGVGIAGSPKRDGDPCLTQACTAVNSIIQHQALCSLLHPDMHSVLRTAKNYTKGYSDTQSLVRNATSNDPLPPSGTDMNAIAQMTYNQCVYCVLLAR
jgi:hypothetical protein